MQTIYFSSKLWQLLSTLHDGYCMAQNFDGENIDEFDKFPAIR